MKKQFMKQYFDEIAPRWDAMEEKDDAVIGTLLTLADIGPGQSVLDVACGTGILFPYYLQRGVTRVTGLDLSDAMLAIAREKFPGPEIRLICADAETFQSETGFDRIMIYNAFPHFPDPAELIRHLSTLVNPGGLLCVAHGMSRQQINLCHAGSASTVSMDLLPADTLAELFRKAGLQVTVCTDSDTMYQVCGRKA